jgi:anti-sigma regulatory factor (Ser/Thr protein kinase)
MPASSGVPDAESPAAPPDPGARWRRVFPGDQPQLAALRRWLNSLLPECDARSDVVCVATELGTNAVLHTATGRGGWFAVEVTWYGSVVRVAVADCGGPGQPQVYDHADGEHGRGLAVVRGLAVRLGFQGDHHGRLVWADIPWDQSCLRAAPPVDRVHQARWADSNGSWHVEAASLSA